MYIKQILSVKHRTKEQISMVIESTTLPITLILSNANHQM